MDLKSDHPFWLDHDGVPASYPILSSDVQCEVAVIGGGISGALAAYTLTKAGVEVVVLDKRLVGHGSTSATTGLLLYELDTPLIELAKKMGELEAARVFQLCVEANRKFGPLTQELGDACDLQPRRSLYLASTEADVPALAAECEARRRAGIDVRLLSRSEIESCYSFRSPAAILSAEAAQVDAYRLTHRLLQRATARGARVFERTEITGHEPHQNHVVLVTESGSRITARRVVVAAGYETQPYLKQQIVDLHSSFAVASEPLETFDGWDDRCLIWETARPYLYLRTTADGRAMVGGADEPFRDPARRDAMVRSKAQTLVSRFEQMFPAIPFRPASAWAGTFGQTVDGMPYIGRSPEFPLGFFALGYGGNGITFSLIAAEIIRDLYTGRENGDARLFRFSR